MNKFRSKTITYVGSSIILVVLLLLMGLWVKSVADNTERMRNIVEEFEEAQLLSLMRDIAYRRAITLHRMQATSDPFVLDEENQRFHALFETFVKARDEFLQYDLDEHEIQAWERAKKILNTGSIVQNRAAKLLLQGRQEEGKAVLLQEVVPTQDSFVAQLTAMMDAEVADVGHELAIATVEGKTTYYLVTVLGTVALMLGGMAIVIGRRSDKAEAALMQQGERIRALYEVSAAPGLSLDEQVKQTLELGCRLLGMEIGKVCRIDTENNKNIFINVFAQPGLDVQAGTEMPLDQTFCSITYSISEPLAIHDVAKSNYAKRFSHLAAYIATTITVNGVKYGTINFSSNHPRQARFTDTDKDLVNLIGSWISVTLERKFSQDQLRQAKEGAEDANRTKSIFLANTSHELRTPLNAILGYTELLREEVEAAQHQQYYADIDRILTAGHHLLELINDVLDLSKIEAGKMLVNVERFPLRPVCEEVIETIQPLITKNQNTLVLDCPDNIGDIQADKTMVKQILLNLLSNASKFTENGDIRFTARRHEDGGWVTFEVQDSGIGMTPEQLERVFDIFSQADSSIKSKYGGTGLGLAISRRMANLMGGDINAQSEPGQGAKFIVTLPTFVAQEQVN